MNKRTYNLVLILISIHFINGVKTHIEGYYWRDFEGIIPEDALPGGLDRNGLPIYIAQVLFENKLIPGELYENDPNVYYEWAGQVLTATDNVKILCSQYPEKLEWLPTKHDVVRLTNKLLIKGGYEPGRSIYIGRAYSTGETNVGKVVCRETDCSGLYVARDGKRIKHRAAFEVLSFNPKMSTKENSDWSKIDIRTGPE
ncbi:hypothetical protein ILUMI_10527 [Ignelater luminosus]|uniref:DUF3421 domain-containing protein n=1 Tax=Ignelater luminosus TaxID=2038154 RepID=A0A8K0D371_IGNLU|nr:hypothetical protein ILUMI_10527 [Ignelater luminosus]